MKEAIRRRARELGFDDCRFTSAQPPDSAQRFQDWLAQGKHGYMAYLERNAFKRIMPERVLAGAKSIIVVAASYARAPSPMPGAEPKPADGKPGNGADRPDKLRAPLLPQHGSGSEPRGIIARYAQYDDYHEVLASRLKDLADFVTASGGVSARSLWYVDTGPVLERDLAQRAGIGFVGKHTNVISRRLGNWIFLAEIITTLEIEPDSPEANHCGSCTSCLSACPTGAITAPFQLDARLCISYLTIELKGPIPVELRSAIGNRIYGCDDCLAICPWNRFAREGKIMRPHARFAMDGPSLAELLRLTEAGFKQRFAGTPMLRTRRRGLLRNVCVALGNTGDESACQPLEIAALDPEPLVAEHARWALERIRQRLKL